MDLQRGKPDLMASDVRAKAAVERLRYQFSRLQTAPQFAAVLDFLFDLHPLRTEPAFDELVVVDNRLVFARAKGERSFRHFVGRRDQLVVNLVGFVRHLGLGTYEHEFVLNRIDSLPRRTTR